MNLVLNGITFYSMRSDIVLLLSKLLDESGFINHMG